MAIKWYNYIMINKMLDELIEMVEQHKITPVEVCYYLRISPTTWRRWQKKECFTNQYDRLMKVHDFIQHPEKYHKSA